MMTCECHDWLLAGVDSCVAQPSLALWKAGCLLGRGNMRLEGLEACPRARCLVSGSQLAWGLKSLHDSCLLPS